MRALGRFGVGKSPRDINKAVRGVVAHARCEIPYYRDLLKMAPRVIGVEGLHHLPITTKRDLVAQQDVRRITRAGRAQGRRVIGTSGTSGQVLLIRMSRMEALFRSYAFLRSLRENCRTSWPLTITELGVGPPPTSLQRSLLERLSIVHLERIPRLLPIEEQADRLCRSASQVITGQATCLAAVARHLVRSGRRVRARLVVSRGEVLLPHMGALLRDAFDARVVDYYNCEEVGNVAYLGT